MLVGLEKRFLQHVLGVFAILRDVHRETKNLAFIAVESGPKTRSRRPARARATSSSSSLGASAGAAGMLSVAISRECSIVPQERRDDQGTQAAARLEQAAEEPYRVLDESVVPKVSDLPYFTAADGGFQFFSTRRMYSRVSRIGRNAMIRSTAAGPAL